MIGPLSDLQKTPVFDITSDIGHTTPKDWPIGNSRGWGWRRLARFKTVNGRRFQLHATRGWKCIGRVEA